MKLTKKGFSLVELMIVVAIIGILVAALLPQLQNMISSAKESNAKQSLKALSDAITRFNAVEPRECTNLQWLVPNYMKEIKRDPWGSMYSLNAEDGVILSFGPDKRDGLQPYTGGETSANRRDNIEFYFKPKLGIAQAKLSLDVDGNGKLNNGDRITIFFTRVAKTTDIAGTSGVAFDATDFVFCDRFEDDQANELWLYDNSPMNSSRSGAVTTPTSGLMFANSSFVTHLTGGNVSAFATPTFQPVARNGTAGTGYILEGGDDTATPEIEDDTYVTFEISVDSNWELDAELFVRFSPGSTAPQTGKYRDSRGNTAIQNGYNVKIETYF